MTNYRPCKVCGQPIWRQRAGYSPYWGLLPKCWRHYDPALDARHRASPVPAMTLDGSLRQAAERQAADAAARAEAWSRGRGRAHPLPRGRRRGHHKRARDG